MTRVIAHRKEVAKGWMMSWTAALRKAYAHQMAAGTKSGSVEWMLLIALACLIGLIVYTAH
jgi:hypothetical protein